MVCSAEPAVSSSDNKRASRSPELAQSVCEVIASGDSLRQACSDLGVSKPFILDWLREDEEFATHYTHARARQAETYADEIVEIADTEPDPAKARVRVDSRKWVAAKLLPKKYGEKLGDVHVTSVTNNFIVLSEERQKAIQETRRAMLE